jgi:PAS domain S-box-containing protein
MSREELDLVAPEAGVGESLAAAAERARHLSALRELKKSESYSRLLFHAALTGLLIVDTRTRCILDANRAAASILGTQESALIGRDASGCGVAELCTSLRDGCGAIDRHQAELRRHDGTTVPVILSATAMTIPDRELAVLSFMDISDLSAVQEELRRANRQLETALLQLHAQRDAIVQSEKLASIGQLAAGVAHEINNPIGFVTSNLATISEYLEFMRTLITLYRRLRELPPGDGARADLELQLATVLEEEDLDYVLGDLDSVLAESVEGASRVTEIVQNLKSFARHDSQQKKPIDLNDCVESMIRLVWNELKYSCTIRKELAPLPPVLCHGGQISQVVMNILVNAAHAIGEDGGTITIRTWVSGEEAVISIADTGRGMTSEVMARIFEPFFTTKDVGKGTGLGLSISHGIITDHGGRIEVESTPGAGSTFRIVLPLPAGVDDTLIG